MLSQLKKKGKMQLRRLESSMSTKDPVTDLRPCQKAYLGESNARRLLKRAHLSRKSSHDEPIFSFHEEGTPESPSAAAAAPFEPTSPKVTSSYDVQCYATHAEDAQKRKEAEAAEKEKMVLFTSINNSRQFEGLHRLPLKPSLCKIAQDHADMLFDEDYRFATPIPSHEPVMVCLTRSGTRTARLVSPPGRGALGCGEMWYGGKYQRPVYNTASESAGEHPGHLRIIFETMMDEAWNAIGVGRGDDGRWVVQLA